MFGLIHKIRITHKFALIGLLALGTVALPASLVVKRGFDDLNVART